MSISRAVMQRFYARAEGAPDRLPWHRESPSDLLAAVVGELPCGRRALDVGCGAGTLSVWLAQRGLVVTAVDLFPDAIAMARGAAEDARVDIECIVSDIFEWTPGRRFDLIYDSGCLHSLVGASARRYRELILQWLEPEGRFVLEHWGKRHFLDWRPIGPRRRSRSALKALFGPDLEIVGAEQEDFAAPLPFGPTVRGAAYAFRHRPS